MKFLAFTVAVFAVISVANAGPSTQPYMSVDDIPVPPARETASPPAPVASSVSSPVARPSVPGSVAILPFESLGDSAGKEWVTRALQQSLETGASRLGGISVVSADVPAGPIDTAMARSAAKNGGADAVVFGSEQFSGEEVRFTGQVVDVKTGVALGGLKASGDFRDLFELEDDLSSQLERALRPPPADTADVAAASKYDSLILTQPVANLQPSDVSSDANSAYSDAYRRYNYDWTDWSSFYYGGAFPYYGGGFGGYYGYGVVSGHSHHDYGYAPRFVGGWHGGRRLGGGMSGGNTMPN